MGDKKYVSSYAYRSQEDRIPKSARTCPNFGQFIHDKAFVRPKVCMENGFSEVCNIKGCCCYRSYLTAQKYNRTGKRPKDGIVNPGGDAVNAVCTGHMFRR